MGVGVEKLSANKFAEIARNAHLSCFNEDRPDEFNRYDYALVCHRDHEALTAYATILEHDADSAYMQHGGTFSDNGMLTVKSYLLMIAWLKAHYPVITTRIFNDNIPMLKLALTAGLRIHGIEYYKESVDFKGGVLLCLKMEGHREQ